MIADWIDYYTPQPSFMPGDANRDGVVSAGDYASVQANFGNTGEPGTGILGDANNDGLVSSGDYASIQHWITPEPAMLWVLISFYMLKRRNNETN